MIHILTNLEGSFYPYHSVKREDLFFALSNEEAYKLGSIHAKYGNCLTDIPDSETVQVYRIRGSVKQNKTEWETIDRTPISHQTNDLLQFGLFQNCT